MKKLLTLLLSITTLISSMGLVMVSAEDEDYSKYLTFVQKLDIMDEIDSPYSTLSRSSLAEYLSNVLVGPGEEETADKLFEDDNYDQLLIPSTDLGVFDDVPKSDAAYRAIRIVAEMGVMNGTGNRTFSPDSEVTFRQTATVMVRMLGYGPLVGNGNIMKKAEEIGIFDGIIYNADDKITVGQLAKVFYNCFDIDVVVTDVQDDHIKYIVEEDCNIYAKRRNIYREDGRLQKNPFTSIDAETGAGEDAVVIDGIEYIADDEYSFYELIGRDVEVYYEYDKKEKTRTILWGYPTNYDEVITVNAEDVIGFANRELSYYEGERENVEDVELGFGLIYNGVYKGSYLDSDFDFETGNVTIIRPRKSGGKTVVVVNNYSSMRVTSTDIANKKIFAKQYYDEKGANAINLNRYEDWQVQIFYDDGNIAELKDVTVGSVIDVISTGNYIKMIVSANVMSDMRITGAQNGTKYHEYEFNDEQIYKMPDSYYQGLARAQVSLELGGTYNVAINSFGQFFDISSVANEDRANGYVYITEKGSEQFLEGALGYVRYLNQTGTEETALIAKNAVVYTENGDSFRVKKTSDIDRITKSGAPYTGIAVIEKDEYDMVKKIMLPLKNATGRTRENVLGTISEGKAVFFMKANGVSFFEGVIPSENCIIYDMPEIVDGETQSRILSLSDFSNAKTYVITAYNFNSSSVRADCILVDTEVSQSLYSATDIMYVVDDIYEGIYDDEPTTMMKVHSVSNYLDVETKEIPVKGNAASEASTFLEQDRNNIVLKRGDIICARFDGAELEKAYLVYRIYVDNPGDSPLYSTTGKYSDTDSGVNFTNPYAVYPEVGTDGKYALLNDTSYYVGSIRSNGMRFFGGYIYEFEDEKYLRYTSQPIDVAQYSENDNYTEPGDGEQDVAGYLTEMVIIPNKYSVVEVYANKINVRNATVADIITYMEAGNSCSEAFVHTSAGTVRQLVLINRVE